jgi:hypothetical protein
MLYGPLINRIEWVSIDEILDNWGSCDSGIINVDCPITLGRDQWDTLLNLKRQDKCYIRAYDNIKRDGFLIPLSYYITDQATMHGNGHHRLAIAIDLGYIHVPYVQVKGARQLGWYWRKCLFAKYDFKANNPQNRI